MALTEKTKSFFKRTIKFFVLLYFAVAGYAWICCLWLNYRLDRKEAAVVDKGIDVSVQGHVLPFSYPAEANLHVVVGEQGQLVDIQYFLPGSPETYSLNPVLPTHNGQQADTAAAQDAPQED